MPRCSTTEAPTHRDKFDVTSSALLKLAVPDRTAAVLRAKEAGLDAEPSQQ
jgi:hypothetical protein